MRLLTPSSCLAAALIVCCGPAGSLTAGDESPALKAGDKAPDIRLPAVQTGKVNGHTLRLSHYRGKKNVVLYFYPKALTGG